AKPTARGSRHSPASSSRIAGSGWSSTSARSWPTRPTAGKPRARATRGSIRGPSSSTSRRGRRRRLSASSDGGRRARHRGGTPFRLLFDYLCSYSRTDLEFRPLPRLPLYVAREHETSPPAGVMPVLDTGADYTVFDGTLAAQLGWHEQELVDGA